MFLFIVTSCEREEKKPPIDESKFEEVLIDVHLLQARLENYKSLSDTFFYATGKGYEEIYQKHGISKAAFKETFEFYLTHPKQMDKMYERITEKFSEMEAKAKE